MSEASEVVDHWGGDVLKRADIARHLSRVVRQEVAQKGGSLCFAIDGQWGAGKTFFVERWAKELKAEQHPVIEFDSWANDLSDDPLVGFLSHFKKGIDDLLESRSITETVKSELGVKLKAFIKAAPKAIWPATKVLVAGGLKKALSVDLSDLSEVVKEASEPASEALSSLFEAATESHLERQEAVQELKRQLADLLKFLEDKCSHHLPMFVFVDELDRCRPDYAIRLLEGIKHLFDAPGLCFVVSTNLEQLAASAKARYGEGFDGYGYLKRFFSFEYVLPAPDPASYARTRFEQSPLSKGRLKLVSALKQHWGSVSPDAVDVLTSNFALIVQAHKLDLRTQDQVIRVAEYAATGLDDNAECHVLWLFALAAARHKGESYFAKLRAPFPLESFVEEYYKGVMIPVYRPNRDEREEVVLFEVMRVYIEVVGTPIRDYLNRDRVDERLQYPGKIWNFFDREIRGGVMADDRFSIASYFKLVATAGQFRTAL